MAHKRRKSILNSSREGGNPVDMSKEYQYILNLNNINEILALAGIKIKNCETY
jgi:hypothetical protein